LTAIDLEVPRFVPWRPYVQESNVKTFPFGTLYRQFFKPGPSARILVKAPWCFAGQMEEWL
jgi:hypothetical protein